MSLFYPSPSPVPSCNSSSSDEHSDTVPPTMDSIYSSNVFPSKIIKPDPIFPSPTLALQLAQLQMMWQPMTNFLALCQLNINQQPLFEKNKPFVDNIQPRKRPRPPSTDIPKKAKTRKMEDTVTSSPVNGMFIKDASSVPSSEQLQKQADALDETAAYVEISEESRTKISQIHDVIGDIVCCLCKVKYDDVFRLAQHRCPRIAHEEYKCPECEKTFSCPANLASHRRWHRPRQAPPTIPCPSCGVSFPDNNKYSIHLSTCQSQLSLSNILSAIQPSIKLEIH